MTQDEIIRKALHQIADGLADLYMATHAKEASQNQPSAPLAPDPEPETLAPEQETHDPAPESPAPEKKKATRKQKAPIEETPPPPEVVPDPLKIPASIDGRPHVALAKSIALGPPGVTMPKELFNPQLLRWELPPDSSDFEVQREELKNLVLATLALHQEEGEALCAAAIGMGGGTKIAHIPEWQVLRVYESLVVGNLDLRWQIERGELEA
jgi:hypothetical protein